MTLRERLEGWRGWVTWLTGGAVGSLGTALLFRFFLIDQLAAQETQHTQRMVAIEQRVDRLEVQVPVIGGDVRTILNAVCAQYTQREQVTRQMQCPPAIYRGAP